MVSASSCRYEYRKVRIFASLFPSHSHLNAAKVDCTVWFDLRHTSHFVGVRHETQAFLEVQIHDRLRATEEPLAGCLHSGELVLRVGQRVF